jgi:tetratricopeptide (TPR) repeat protein
VRNYNKMITPDDGSKRYVAEMRGKVQNRNVYVELEPMFVLTFYKSDKEGARAGYNRIVEELNVGRDVNYPLLLTNSERALAGGEVERHFARIDEASKYISDAGDDATVRRERAIDYYLVQDLEAAMADIEKAVEGNGNAWENYFIRAFVRYRLLEVARLDEAGDAVVPAVKQLSALPDIDYRLVKADLDRVIEMQPMLAEAWFNRANVSAKLNDFKSAIVDYSRAIELDDRFAEAYFNRGLAKIYTGNADGGVVDLSRAGELGLFQAYNVIKRFRFQPSR